MQTSESLGGRKTSWREQSGILEASGLLTLWIPVLDQDYTNLVSASPISLFLARMLDRPVCHSEGSAPYLACCGTLQLVRHCPWSLSAHGLVLPGTLQVYRLPQVVRAVGLLVERGCKVAVLSSANDAGRLKVAPLMGLG